MGAKQVLTSRSWRLLPDLSSAGMYHSRRRLRTESSGCPSQSAMYKATLSKEQQRASVMPKDHSASPLSCGLLMSGNAPRSSLVQTSSGSWGGKLGFPSPKGDIPPSGGGPI